MIAPTFSHFSISNEKIAMPFHNLYHNCPVKQQSQAKNHRKTKIPFPFLTTNLQPDEIALHYFRRGWGHTSLNLLRAGAYKQKALPMTAGKKLLATLPCFCRRSARHRFLPGSSAASIKSSCKRRYHFHPQIGLRRGTLTLNASVNPRPLFPSES